MSRMQHVCQGMDSSLLWSSCSVCSVRALTGHMVRVDHTKVQSTTLHTSQPQGGRQSGTCPLGRAIGSSSLAGGVQECPCPLAWPR